jgi:tRNA (guanine10-N2)-dimethyltransferase
VNSRLFFQLSGEHQTLPAAEVLAILESEKFDYDDVKLAPSLLTLTAKQECICAVVQRSGMCEAAGRLVFECADDQKAILKAASRTPFAGFLEPGRSFSVKVIRILGSSKHLRRLQLQSKIGDRISRSVPESKVDLNTPEQEFVGIIGEGYFTLCSVFGRRQDLGEEQRKPKRRPAFHPSTVKPRFARCLVNLARARKGEVLIDPFCGVGGILIEAGIMGCRILGSDLDLRMVRSACNNIKHFNLEPEGLILADARRIPYIKAPSIATDPPYGRGASTMGSEPKRLVKDFLSEVTSILSHDGFGCFASALGTDVRRLVLGAGLNIVERHVVRVHRSLTREIIVFSLSKQEHRRRLPWSSYS